MFRQRFTAISAILAASMLSLSAAHAATATATFDVLIKIQPSCTVTAGSASNINFGTVAANATAFQQGSSSITVHCSKTTAYTVGLLPASGSTAGAGQMAAQNTAPASGNNDKVQYQLRQATGDNGAVWGNVSGNWKSGSGTGTDQTLPVYATVAVADLNKTPDDYKETVTVTVTY